MHWLDKVLDIFAAPTADLRVLAGIAGYDPKVMYKGTSMAGLDLSQQDVSDLDLEIGDADELPFTSARAKQYIIDNLQLPKKWSEKILHFRASNRKIRDISQLEYCLGLREVKLNSTLVTDLTPLENCDQLRKIEVAGTNIQDIGALRNKKNLRFVNLSGTLVEDISPLKGIPLNYLYISRTNVRKLSEVRLDRLYEFSASGVHLDNWLPLSLAIYMKVLNISSTNVDDLSFISKMRYLTYLYIADTHATMPDDARFPFLTNFYARGSVVDDISFLEDSFSIREINIDNTMVSSIKPLEEKKNLRSFSAKSCKITGVDALKNCYNLSNIDLSGNNIVDVGPLSDLGILNRLNLMGTNVTDLSCLNKTQLKILNIADCKFLDWSSISSLSGVVQMHLKEEPGDKGFEDFYIPLGVKYLFANPSYIENFRRQIEERDISAFASY